MLLADRAVQPGGGERCACTAAASLKLFHTLVSHPPPPCTQDTIAEELSSRDRQALAHLTSIRAVAPGGGPPVLEFAFSSNPFFTNSTLRRGLGSDDGTGTAAVTTDIQWKDTAHKLTVKVRQPAQRGDSTGVRRWGVRGLLQQLPMPPRGRCPARLQEVKKGGGGKKKKSKGGKGGGNDEGAAGGGSVKLKPCASFFRFFLPESSSNSSSSAAARLHDPAALRGDDDDEDDDVRARRGVPCLLHLLCIVCGAVMLPPGLLPQFI